jgi:hypothetical protein
MAKADVCSQCGAPRDRHGRCRFCGARRALAEGASAPATPAEEAALRIGLSSFVTVSRIVTCVGLGILGFGAAMAYDAFGWLPALLFAGFAVAWIAIGVAQRRMARAQHEALEEEAAEDA